MFLDLLLRRNPNFLKAAVALHQQGKLPANSYVLDLDAITANARLLAKAGEANQVKVFGMTKQLGRCPDAVRAMIAGGLKRFVAVDMDDARALYRHGFGIGHLGHLVQIPKHEIAAAITMRPDYLTLFSTEKIKEAGAAAGEKGVTQKVLLRIQAPGDRFYKGHEGGFPAASVVEAAKAVTSTNGLEFAGITTFPALLFDEKAKTAAPTPNLETLRKAAAALREAGFAQVEINAPGTTSSELAALLAKAGASQIEPGHALTGTTPLHAVRDLPELPAVAYLSEIAHIHDNLPYCFGGGLYIDPVFPDYQVTGLVGSDPEKTLANRIDVEFPPATAIDYYGIFHPRNGGGTGIAGDSVLFGFRPQAFVTRAYVSGIAGVASGRPEVTGIWKPDGSRSEWPF